METINGVVESVSRTGKQIKVNGEWYGAFAPASLNGAAAGSTVRFTSVKSKDGQYNNIKGSVTVVGGGAATPAAGEGSAPRSAAPAASYGRSSIAFPLPPLDGQRVIVRQNALGHATKLVVEAGYHSGEDSNASADLIIELARKFEAYVAGDLDLELATRSE